ncbi:hypothetical protein HF313_26085 [Massilia atriviolacea]|uniref:Uncharacterized protein n=1 Tax=Massilia atriviolacea TaxID=2495579 RepID=A0A430HMW7_9BURK|nr:hypothetical protein [Massilia atriviolacea]RSZ58865.1 hypothetical protein EJB06_11010 [Massilia atriviolacea]
MKINVLFRFGVLAAVTLIAVGCGTSREIASVKPDAGHVAGENIATQMFEQRCRGAGEKIYKQVDNVDGVFLLRIRPENINFSDQYALDDPYGRDFNGDAYIRSFLRGFYESNYGKSDNPILNSPLHLGYRYVDAIDKADGHRYRYVAIIERPGVTDSSFAKDYRRFVLRRTLVDDPAPRYGVTYEDISTKEERDHWIAGSSLKVIDLKTNEILAERIGYMYDPGQGSNVGGRAPWLIAANYSCPSFGTRRGSSSQTLQSETFVGKVLKPSKYGLLNHVVVNK